MNEPGLETGRAFCCRSECVAVDRASPAVIFRSMSRRKATRRDRREERPRLAEPETCWLCGRTLGGRVEWHHPFPKSRGGREIVPVHPICHRAIHAQFSNKELAHMAEEGESPAAAPDMQRFLAWVAGKPPDFHAPTRSRRDV
jgi:hypothetical protein